MSLRPAAALSLLATLTAAWSCHDQADREAVLAAASTAEPASPPAGDAGADAGPPPRCATSATGPRGSPPAATPFGESADLGEAVAIAGGFAIGALRPADGGRVASVIRVGEAAGAAADLGASWGDAPAPQPFVRGDEVYAVGYVRPRASPSPAIAPSASRPRRALSVFRAGSTPERTIQLPTEDDSSSTYDVVAAPASGPRVGALIAWDDDVGAPRHGVIQLAVLAPDLRAVRAVRAFRAAAEVSGDAADAADPRLATRTDGYWLTWLARRPEHGAPGLPLPAGEIETPSEESTYCWVEALALDVEGRPAGTARRLTPATGHVGSYAIASRDDALVVVAADDGGSGGRVGARLEQIVWRGTGAPEQTQLVRSGVEEETPPFLWQGAGSDLWLSFLDIYVDTEILPLSLRPTPDGHAVPSREPSLRGTRVLGVVDGKFALATTDGTRWTLRWASCVR